jgi:hypothetical protein
MENREYTEALTSFTLPTYNEIPDVGLYLDQVVKYINGFFGDFPEMKITSAMVSNYVKQKIISSPYKKTYSRDQIASLLFIVIAKTVLSMGHIRMCLAMSTHFDSSEEAYTAFVSRMKDVLESLSEDRSDALSFTADRTLDHIVITAAHKMYLERYFETIEEQQKEQAEEKKELNVKEQKA